MPFFCHCKKAKLCSKIAAIHMSQSALFVAFLQWVNQLGPKNLYVALDSFSDTHNYVCNHYVRGNLRRALRSYKKDTCTKWSSPSSPR